MPLMLIIHETQTRAATYLAAALLRSHSPGRESSDRELTQELYPQIGHITISLWKYVLDIMLILSNWWVSPVASDKYLGERVSRR